jgi:hypothetical protein
VESFGSRVRDAVLSVEAFDSVIEAQTVMDAWKDIHNQQRLHSSHGWRTPAAFAATVTEGAQHNRRQLVAAAGPTNGPVTRLTALPANDSRSCSASARGSAAGRALGATSSLAERFTTD